MQDKHTSSLTDVIFGKIKVFDFILKIIARDVNNETFISETKKYV